AAAPAAVPAGGRARSGRPRPRTHAEAPRGREAPSLGRTPRPRVLSAARQYAAADLAGRVVLVPDRREPGQAQHLRLPRPRRADVPAEVKLRGNPAAAAGAPPGEVPPAAGPARRPPAAQEQTVLGRVERVRHLQLRPA